MAGLIVTIDGPAGSGKSTVARLLAQRLGASFLDTGAMYRAVTVAAMNAGVDMTNRKELADVMDKTIFEFTAKANEMIVSVDGVDVTKQIRSEQVTANARFIAAAAELRARLVRMQRQFAAGQEKIVTEGRDQGTVAFPDAHVKFYLTADAAERARRRFAELKAKGGAASLEQTRRAIEERDRSDQNRDVGPLKPADDAVVVDTTCLNLEQVVDKLFECVRDNA